MRLLLVLLALVSLGATPKVDVVFIGAHPDDDSGATAYLASLIRDRGARVAVITATRGEGGGNAIGPETGAALGRIREQEERAALGSLGITEIHYLDLVDFGYTNSALATRERWGYEEPRGRLIELLRQLEPEVVITMNPSPSGHGQHQYLARLATEAYFESSARKLYYALSYGSEGLEYDLEYVPDADIQARELRALKLYRSQGWGDLPALGPQFVLGPETFKLAHSCEPRIRPAADVQEFLDWAERLGLALRPITDSTVVAAAGSTVRVPVEGKAVLSAPGLSVRGTEVLAPDRPGAYPLLLDGQRAGTLQVVPSLRIPRGGSSWQPLDTLWEGAADGPADLSGRFMLAWEPGWLVFRAQVKDDRVLAELQAPGAHWRTDAIELCLDPGDSRHTFTTYKLGIVPFLESGRPGAARDADARPGPVSDVKLTSRLVPGGYELEARLPMPPGLQADRRFGLNVLLYDADTPGTLANEARTGWSAWPEVMGIPRLWGQAYLVDE